MGKNNRFKDVLLVSLKTVTGIQTPEVRLPENQTFGDFSTNVAMVQAKEKAVNPRALAEEIKLKLEQDKNLSEYIEYIEIAGPGFINFYLKDEALTNELKKVIKQKEEYGRNDTLKNKKIMFEYGQPNTHKLPHIGHLFSYIYGEATTRLLEASGATIYRANYQGDVGLHVAKCLWAFKKANPKVPEELQDKVELLQKMYQEGSAAYEKDEQAQKDIQAINKMIYQKDPSIVDLWTETRGWSVEYYKKFEERLGTNYDRYYYESQVYHEGLKIVEENMGKVFVKSEGAIIFEGSKYGLHDRVFVTKYQTPTYEAKDLYLENLKFKEWPFDLLVITTANEQNEYFKVVYKALQVVNKKLEGRLKHIGFGMVNLKSGKMSSRTGQIISAVDLVDTVVDRVKQLSTNANNHEEVGMGAIKYSFLKNNPLQNISFSIEESIADEGNSGPYLQYTVARTNSVISKVKLKNVKVDYSKINKEEKLLLRTITMYGEAVEIAAQTYAPNLLCNYLYDLAQKFNGYYAIHKIIDTDNEAFRVELTAAVNQILKNGLKLLGISAPERM